MLATRKTPSKTVGAYEAKTTLSALLDQVERGREIVITRNARNIARLVPNEPPGVDRLIFGRLRDLHARLALPPGETARGLIQSGRRI